MCLRCPTICKRTIETSQSYNFRNKATVLLYSVFPLSKSKNSWKSIVLVVKEGSDNHFLWIKDFSRSFKTRWFQHFRWKVESMIIVMAIKHWLTELQLDWTKSKYQIIGLTQFNIAREITYQYGITHIPFYILNFLFLFTEKYQKYLFYYKKKKGKILVNIFFKICN